MSNLHELYQELILDHGRKPRFCFKPDSYTVDTEGYNPLCGDKVHLYATVQNGIVASVSFEGQGCAISMASTSLMLEIAQQRSLVELRALFHAWHDALMQNTPCCAEHEAILHKCFILKGVQQYPARVKCATLAWHTLENLLQKVEANHE